ncbi:MAG: hypothetical protein A2603_11490 [Bdellovibrionales bacterium RIFOXYD1_FULL_55_31]|nr:MAG: hypothetical protein A2603_11490 [Bdellovibrionales bacterium RIFOXYD1_FULL_55_31]
MNHKILLMAVSAFAFVGAVGAPHHSLAQVTPGADKEVSDADIVTAISRRLFTDRYFSPDDVQVTAADNVVTLTGIVNTLRSKDRAAQISEGVRGVRAVVNRLTIETPKKSDEQLKKDVTTALLLDPTTDAYKLNVDASAGTVTLRGEVGSFAERDLASWVVKGITGVKEVKNEARIKVSQSRSDAEITQDINGRLKREPFVYQDNIQVSTNDGNVVLSGTVSSAAAKGRAAERAWVLGVRSVNDTELKVSTAALKESVAKRSTTPDVSDAAIQKAVEDAFLYDPRVFSFNPDVRVKRGVVTLRGTVDSLVAKEAAAQDARNTVGVAAIVNLLQVKPPRQLSDREIADRVKSALSIFAPTISDEVKVSVKNGAVTLSGSVEGSYQKWLAWDAASRTMGVKSISNHVNIAETGITKLDDGKIRQNAASLMRSDAFLENDDRIEVNVKNGTATLTGSVDTWAESVAATQDAFLGGAKEVVNKLTVRSAPAQSLTTTRFYSSYPSLLGEYYVFPVG